jgi:hypothetical protein
VLGVPGHAELHGAGLPPFALGVRRGGRRRVDDPRVG